MMHRITLHSEAEIYYEESFKIQVKSQTIYVDEILDIKYMLYFYKY